MGNTEVRLRVMECDSYVVTGSGHIAGVVNPPAGNKYQYWTGGKPVGGFDSWFQNAEEKAGSWWPNWHEWILDKNDKMVTPPKMGSKKHKPIENAPGSYVMRKA